MAPRFFSDTPITARHVTLSGPEMHHLAHVHRAREGMDVTLFDDTGYEFAARVRRVQRVAVELEILDRRQVDRELPVDITLGVALPKGDRQKWLVQKAVELGVTRVVPLTTSRSVAQPVHKSLSRLRRAVIEASKQCGRNRLTEVAEPQDVQEYFTNTPASAQRLLAHTSSQTPLLSRCPDLSDAAVVHYALAIGPEGGFTDDEVTASQASGWQLVGLGPRILRIETAALAMVASIVYAVSVCDRDTLAQGHTDDSSPPT